MVESCLTWMLLAPVLFSTSTPMIYGCSGKPLGRMDVVSFNNGLTSYLRVTLLEWKGMLSDYSPRQHLKNKQIARYVPLGTRRGLINPARPGEQHAT